MPGKLCEALHTTYQIAGTQQTLAIIKTVSYISKDGAVPLDEIRN